TVAVADVWLLPHLHVAAVVDALDRVLESRCFATTRHGYQQMLTWMRSFGQLRIASRRRAPTVQGSCAICRTLASRFWRSRHRTCMIAASAAKTMIWMPRTPHTQPSRAGVPSHPKAVMEWWSPCAC